MNTSALRYTLVAIAITILGALGGWYYFLKGESASIAKDDLGRGVGEIVPLGIEVGSTYENIVSSFSTFVGGEVQSDTSATPRLRQAGKTPTAGFGFVEKNGTSYLRFVERGSGYIFDMEPKTNGLDRVTNTLVPRTYEALVAGNHVIMRGLDENGAITTMLSTITATTSAQGGPATMKQQRLEDDIRVIGLNASRNTLFYLVEGPEGTKGIRATWDGKTAKELFSSIVAGWQIDMLDNGQIMLTQNAEDGIAGHTYRVEDGSLKRIVADVPGLTFLPHPSLSAYLYSESAGSGPSLFARTSGTTSPTTLPVRTIAEKCAFAPKELIAYCAVPQQLPPPDFLGRWYRGEIHTTDAWWKVDVRANAAEQLYSSANAAFDVEDPIVDLGGNYIAFRNAADKTLWLLRIAE